MENDTGVLGKISKGTMSPSDLKRYLSHCSPERNIEKQLFTLKGLKCLVNLLKGSKDPKDTQRNLKLSEILTSFIGDNTIVLQKIPQFSYETLLLHLICQASELAAHKLVISWSELMKRRLEPLMVQSEVFSLLQHLSNVLWQSYRKHNQDSIMELLLELETLCIGSSHADHNLDLINKVKKFNALIGFSLKCGQCDVATNTLSVLLSSRLCYQSDECVILIVECFVRIKQVAVKQNPNASIGEKSMKHLLTQAGCCDETISACYLEKELEIYETSSSDSKQWELVVIEDLLNIYTHLPPSLHYAHTMIKKVSVLHELKMAASSPSLEDMICRSISILEGITPDTVEMRCMISEVMGHGFMLKAKLLYSNIVSAARSDDSIPLDSTVIGALVSAVDCWKRLCQHFKEVSPTEANLNKCFRNFSLTCTHIRFCLSYCSVFGLVPHALQCVDVLIFLSEHSWCDDLLLNNRPSFLAFKSRLLLNAYGERFVGQELESAMTEYANIEGAECSYEQIEALLSLALLYCRRGQFSYCNTLLKKTLQCPILSKNTSQGHQLMASLTSVTSHYIQAQSEYIPLMDARSCLYHLSGSPSPICIPCLTKQCTQGCSDDKSQRTRMSELELSLDSVNLSRGLVQQVSERGADGSLTDEVEPVVMVDSSFQLMDNVSEVLCGLYRVAQLYCARESIKEAMHYTMEGLELAKLLCFRYWYVRFLLMLASIHETTGHSSEAADRREQAKKLLQGSTVVEETDLATKLDNLTLQPSACGEEVVSNRPMSCVCDDCLNPIRIVLFVKYLHQMIEGDGLSDIDLLESARRILDHKWTKACDNLTDCTKGNAKPKVKPSRGRKQKTQPSVDYNSEIVVPLEIRNSSLYVQSLLRDNDNNESVTTMCQNVLHKLDPMTLPLLHIPEVRLRLAELHFVIGKTLPSPTILTNVYGTMFPTKTRENLSRVSRRKEARKLHHKRARRIVDSDDEEEAKRVSHCDLPEPLLSLISPFLYSYQLLVPTTLSLRLSRQVCHQLGVFLSTRSPDIAAHFILSASYMSFSMDGVLWAWKKARRSLKKRKKCHNLNLIHQDITNTLSDDPPFHHHSEDHSSLLQSRAILSCLTRPLPLSYTIQLTEQLPEDWVFCSLNLVDRLASSDKVLVLVRVSKGKDCLIAKLPIKADEKTGKGDNHLLQQFQALMDGCIQSATLTDKRKWWMARRKLDSQLKELLSTVEEEWFGVWKILLSCSDCPSRSHELISTALSNNGVVNAAMWAEVLISGRHSLENNDQIHSILQTLTNGQMSVLAAGKICKELAKLKSHSPDSSVIRPLILSLGHPLHKLPFENMPLLRDQSVSRIPSLPFLVAHSIVQSCRDSAHIDPKLTYYIVNPSGDLKNTEKTFAKWFEEEKGWEGVIGTPPTSAQFVYGFEEKRIVIYCGHGRAREYLKEGHIQELDCQATLIQMGCSSGKLQNVGRDLEPTGIVFNFLLAGCPSLVVNLWDVTDIDIDRFCSTLVKQWLSASVTTDHYKLLQEVCRARDSCRLKYAIGASPVVYGLPVSRQQ